MVGAAEGLGGKLMRTVSFLGWTLPVSFFGGTAPLGMLGMFSAINYTLLKTKVPAPGCQTLNPMEKLAAGEQLEVYLSEGEPLQNVPRSAAEQGYKVLEVARVEGTR